MLGDNWDEDALDLTDTELLRLEPGQTISRSYTLCVSEKVDGFIPSDMYKLEVGKRYILGLLPRRWRWIYAEDLPEDVDEDCGLVGESPVHAQTEGERGLISAVTDFLNRRDVAQWKPDCTAVFEVVE